MKPLVVLDIDNTLVFSQVQKFPWRDLCLPQVQIQPHIWCTPRPHLQTFLDFVFENFEVGIWTAATGSYANAVISHFISIIGTHRRLKFVWTALQTAVARDRYGGHKNLSLLRDAGLLQPYQPVVLIDDHPDAKATNFDNCMLIPAFGPQHFGISVADEKQYTKMCGDMELKICMWQLRSMYLG
jgi:TFIIF-interacting CTD phosphatase-like protein